MATTATFYILHGDDELRIEEEAARFRHQFDDPANPGLNTSLFEGTSADVTDVIGAALAFPFLADVRLVLVRGLLGHLTRKGAGNVGKKAQEALLEQLPTLPDWARLVFVERGKIDEKNKLVQLARTHERGYEKLYAVPKDTTNWIIQRAKEVHGVQIDPRAAAALASVTTTDLRTADNELTKLVLYLNGERAITEQDVALLTPYVPDASLFDMVDALAEGRQQAAAKLLHRLLDQQEDLFGLYAMIIRQFRLLLLAREHLANGGYANALAEALAVHPYVAEKVGKQSRRFKLEQLERIYRALHEYDVKMKTGQMEPQLALDLLFAGLGR
jgi:DNA polymerase III subunit delta